TRCTTSPRHSKATTSSSRTVCWQKRCAAKEPAGRRSGCARSGSWPAASRSPGDFRRICSRRCCARTTVMGTASTRSSFTPRGTLCFVLGQVEAGHGCPISMTYSAVPALRVQPEVAAEWEPRLTSTQYDPRMIPATEKTGALCGMAMTEKQGGSDVRANTTRARPLGRGGPGEAYELTGHKWFCSAPMCDAFLTLAQTERGLSCFLLPRWLPDGTRNRFHIQRLKDKLGNRSNASSEVEFDAAWARLVGEEGRGVPTIIEMVNHTRLDGVIGAAATMRQAV